MELGIWAGLVGTHWHIMGLAQELLPRKLSGYQFYREVLGSPRYVVAPMVDLSELVSDFSTNNLNPCQAEACLARRGGHYHVDMEHR